MKNVTDVVTGLSAEAMMKVLRGGLVAKAEYYKGKSEGVEKVYFAVSSGAVHSGPGNTTGPRQRVQTGTTTAWLFGSGNEAS
jgi:hypothetical protein